ncbi:serine hydrolase domain-containing protein [Allomuricauda sp. d1]|uniref:serine hydrolase domain-containing protein n=1 Tax=Allomuricauda sp. d1 TaxID=3136725 RepID=UPI0031D6CD94
MTKNVFPLVLSFLLYCLAYTQVTPKGQQQIDSIFSEWNTNEKPGMAAGLIYGDDIRYTMAYGLADIENGHPNTTQTKFQVDHLSRQFTVLAVLLLEKQGKLSLQDPVSKYVAELPDFKKPLLISHLVNHSSGLNDYEVVKGLLGIREDHVFTHEDALRLIYNQKEPNFTPGTDFSYITSKTELTLLAEIVKKVSSQSLDEFAQKNIFGPLQMKHSLFCEDYQQIISEKAHSYHTPENGFKRKVLNQGHAGPTNLYTSAEDLLKWYANFMAKPSDELTELIQKLDTPVTLDNGNTYDSAWGRMTLGRSFFHKERGEPAYWQYGLVGGYGANVFRFPEQRLISFVLGNNDSYNGYPAMMHANHYIEDKYPEPNVVEIPKSKTRKPTLDYYKKIEGHYWNAKRGLARRIYVSNDSLFYARVGQEQGLPLIPLDKNKFQLQVESDDKIYFNFSEENGQQTYEAISGGSSPSKYVKYVPTEYSERQLQEFTGDFYEPNLACVYRFNIKEGILYAQSPTGRIIELSPVIQDTFRSNVWSLASVVYQRDINGTITGFKINTDGLQNLEFIKIKPKADS